MLAFLRQNKGVLPKGRREDFAELRLPIYLNE